jgi:hypothetical protein
VELMMARGSLLLLGGLAGTGLILGYISLAIGAEVLPAWAHAMGAAGLLLILVYLAVERHQIQDTLSGRKARNNVIAICLVGLLAGSAIGINVMAHQLDKRWDLTADQSFSLSPQTETILADIDEPIEVLGFFSSDSQEERYFYDLTTNMRRHTDQLTVELFDPIRQPSRARQYDITGQGVILRREDESVFVQEPYDESKFRLALLQIQSPEPHSICFSSGHGEPKLDELTQIGDFGIFVSLLEEMNYQAHYVDMLREDEIPMECTVFVAATLDRDWGDAALLKMERYLARGGQVIALPYLPPEDILADGIDGYLEQLPQHFHDHFRRYGIAIGARPIEEQDGDHLPPSSQRATTFYISSAGIASHPITDSIVTDRGSIVAMDTPPLTLTEIEGLVHSPLLWSTPSSVARELDDSQSVGPHAVAAIVEFTEPWMSVGVEEPSTGGRLIVLGSPWAASNLLVVERSAFNADLVMNIVAWLADEQVQLESRYRTDAPVPPLLSEQDTTMVRNIVLLFAPGLAMLAAISTWRRRKRL